ncbi:MAG: sigma-70 family RNA polymerase sigma factor [Planctomycetota bacterium]|nr:MAG: sigma-70 family RNA polymerase sigma factor [Planctomycetota bacterium]
MFARHFDKGASRLTKKVEKRLVTQARRGKEDAARILVDAHKDRLFAFVWRILRNNDDSEEICQEAFLRAFSSLDSFSSEYRFSTWLFTIGYRLCLNHIRRRKSFTGEVDFSTMASSASGVSEQLAQSEEARRLKDKIWEAVDRLSVPQRAAVLLFYREEMSCEQIAKTLGMPMATVKSHLHRARGRLRDSLAGLVKDFSQLESLRDIAS